MEKHRGGRGRTREPLRKPCAYCGKEMLLGGHGRRMERTKYCSRRCLGFGRTIQPTIQTLSREDAAYMAGLFDGEGSVVLYPGGFGGRPRLRYTIANTHLGVLEWCKEVTGTGSIVTKAPWTKPEQMHYKRSHAWQCYGQNAANLLEQQLPWLKIKHGAALDGIESQRLQRVP